MNDKELIRLAYAAFVADRTSQTPIVFARWQDLPESEQRRYTEIAQAVVKEYQAQQQEEATKRHDQEVLDEYARCVRSQRDNGEE